MKVNKKMIKKSEIDQLKFLNFSSIFYFFQHNFKLTI